jgi:hypothetical protein
MPTPNSEHHRHPAQRHARHLQQRGLDVAEDREHAAEADGRDAQREPDLLAPQRAQLAQRAGPGGGARLGTQARIMPTESSATAATKTKAARQPSHWPRAEATGTPSSVPLVSPSITRPTARAR